MHPLTLNKSRKYFYFLGLFLIFLLIVFAYAVFSTVTNKQELEPEPKIQPGQNLSLPQPSPFKDELAKILNLLPYTGENFMIKYFKPTNMVNVYISANTALEFREKKKNAEDFIKSKGIQDICNLNIFWVPDVPQEIRKDIAGDLNTTGCLSFK